MRSSVDGSTKWKKSLHELQMESPPGFKEFDAKVDWRTLDEEIALQLWEDIFKPLYTFDLVTQCRECTERSVVWNATVVFMWFSNCYKYMYNYNLVPRVSHLPAPGNEVGTITTSFPGSNAKSLFWPKHTAHRLKTTFWTDLKWSNAKSLFWPKLARFEVIWVQNHYFDRNRRKRRFGFEAILKCKIITPSPVFCQVVLTVHRYPFLLVDGVSKTVLPKEHNTLTMPPASA